MAKQSKGCDAKLKGLRHEPVAASCPKGGILMRNLSPRKSLVLGLVMVLLLSMVVLQGGFASEYLVAGESVLTPFTGSISLDVNPSIELKMENGAVTQALAYNDEGQGLLADTPLSGLTAEDAVKVMTKALIAGGYLAPADISPYLVITVSGGGAQEENASEALKSAAKQTAEELGVEFEVESAFVTDDVAAQAAALGLSTGRYLLMQYIAKTEDITLEEAIAKYGTARIGELMDQFEDAKELFDDDGLVLSDEQRIVLEAAFEQQKETIKAAERTFHDAFKALKSTYRGKAHSTIKSEQGEDNQSIADALNLLKEQMLAEYHAVRLALDEAVSAARSTFMEAVAAALIPEEVSGQYYNWHMNKELNTEGELKAFLKTFTYKAEGKDNGLGQTPGKTTEYPGNGDQQEDKTDSQGDKGKEDQNSKGRNSQDQAKDQNKGKTGKNDGESDSNSGKSSDKGNNGDSGKDKK